MFQALMNGFTLVRTILDQVGEHNCEYRIHEVQIVRDQNGSFYVREYVNECCSGANGRPSLFVKEEYIPVEDPDSITESNWQGYCLHSSERIVVRECSETGFDAEAAKYARQMMEKRLQEMPADHKSGMEGVISWFRV